jgi:hypothetical protein
MYKLINELISNKLIQIERLSDGAIIPLDPANTDYQAFLLWKSEGNEPLPADE